MIWQIQIELIQNNIQNNATAAAAAYIIYGQGRDNYLKDLQEKVESGSSRIKRRSKTVKKCEKVAVSSKLKGEFIELSEYKKDLFGQWVGGGRLLVLLILHHVTLRDHAVYSK